MCATLSHVDPPAPVLLPSTPVRLRVPGARGAKATADALLDEAAELTAQNSQRRDPIRERRILRLRHLAGIEMTNNGAAPAGYPEPAFESLPGGGLPEVTATKMTPELLRAAVLRNGGLLVRGLIDTAEANRLADRIDRAFEAREAKLAGDEPEPGYYSPFVPESGFSLSTRGWVTNASGIWAADSPAVLVDVLDTLERAGLRQLATEYIGERPALSVNKCTLRRVAPDVYDSSAVGDSRAEDGAGKAPSGWHQDGAFLGEVRALNVWLSLTRCGDVAPGLDIVPRRIDHVVPTGTEGAAFDWSVSQTLAEEVAGDSGIQRPIFQPGDVMLFDELFLHATAADPEMTDHRHAVESWFFGPSRFPQDYVPLAF
jgi:hypothetical protein